MSELNVTVLGDDIYCHQPLCQQLLDQHLNFILVCRPQSHTTLYEHLQGIELPTVTVKRWTGTVEETYIYRYLNGVSLRDGEDTLLVNWCELTVSRPDGTVTYKNSFATNHNLNDANVVEIVLAGRTRWKVENENNNTLKTKGYNLEHNFGHGKQHLSSCLATLASTDPLSVLRQLGSFAHVHAGRSRARYPAQYQLNFHTENCWMYVEGLDIRRQLMVKSSTPC